MIDSRRAWHIPIVMAKPFLVVSALLLATLACEARQADDELVGRSCEIENEATMCEPWVVDAELEYGPCLSEEELECEPGEIVSMGSQELCGEMFKRCIAVGGVPTWIEDECDTPLVLRFDDQPITMIPAESTPMATFDISMRADSCIMTDWPEATKRAVIAASPRVHRLKGTVAAGAQAVEDAADAAEAAAAEEAEEQAEAAAQAAGETAEEAASEEEPEQPQA